MTLSQHNICHHTRLAPSLSLFCLSLILREETAWGFLTSATLHDPWLRLAHSEPESPLCSLTLEIRGDSGGQGRYEVQNSHVLQKCAYSNANAFIKSFIMLYHTCRDIYLEISENFICSPKLGYRFLWLVDYFVVLLMHACFSLTLVSVVLCEGFQRWIQMSKPPVNLWSIGP